MELNRNQIIKALEWCSELRLCVDCPMRAEGYFSHSGNACRKALMENALALIRELVEENERLKDSECDPCARKLLDERDKAKADAARRIQNLLKTHAYHIDFPKWHRVVDEDDIDMICENVMNGKE